MAAEGEDDKMPIPSLPASAIALPRVTIQFCTQCKWMLRATYVRETSHEFLIFSLSSILAFPISYRWERQDVSKCLMVEGVLSF
jgi:hypothetical protein